MHYEQALMGPLYSSAGWQQMERAVRDRQTPAPCWGPLRG